MSGNLCRCGAYDNTWPVSCARRREAEMALQADRKEFHAAGCGRQGHRRGEIRRRLPRGRHAARETAAVADAARARAQHRHVRGAEDAGRRGDPHRRRRAAVPAAGRSDPVQGADLCRRADPGGGRRIEEIAAAAIEAIKIDFEQLPHVVDPLDACIPAASTPARAATSRTSSCPCRPSSGRPRTSTASTRARCRWASPPRSGRTAISMPASRRPRWSSSEAS